MKSIKQSKTKDFTFAPRTACILGSHSGMRIAFTIRNFRRTRQSAIGQSFPLSLETVSEVFAEVTSVLDNMRPPLIKTFFFFLWRQSNRYCGRIHCVCQINVAITSRSCKLKLMLEGTYRFVFTLPYLCFFRIWKLHRNDLFLPCFSEKKI